MSLSDTQRDAVESAWKQFIDCNDKGILDVDEWQRSIERLNCGLNASQIRSVFKFIDQQNSGHIDQSDFVQAILNEHNQELSIILQSLVPKHATGAALHQNHQHAHHRDHDEDRNKWRKIYQTHFGELATVNQDVWIDKMARLQLADVEHDDLRLFHACLDSRFRNAFDFDEFYETFTIDSLHHQQMDELRDRLSDALFQRRKPPAKQQQSVSVQTSPKQKQPNTAHTKSKAVEVQTKEISIQTEIFNVRDQLRSYLKQQQQTQSTEDDDTKHEEEHCVDEEEQDEYDAEIDDLERHILEEEKYLEIMDQIDVSKKKNGKLFKWENAYLWNEYQVINWLNDIGFKQANYINAFHEKRINGEILLNELSVEILVNEMGVEPLDAQLIKQSIFILRNIKDKMFMNANESKQASNENLRFYKQKCEHLNRELVKMRKIEQMFKKNRRETEAKLKRLECNLYFGSLNQAHLVQKFDMNQLFDIQAAHHQTLHNIQQAIRHKVNENVA
eukprot:CAMPEP_0197036878 /NCGR_PEP_ID=MMETSP1384-20130603/14244_1 /TAXON_ID=29189 /ORGANISM="Ammonia sp." /LENGTH=502 /DNA_ID=CAMNT_0042467101 /DNA_START=20 /DNA_END=1524 /DNA_ORIENTATION=+